MPDTDQNPPRSEESRDDSSRATTGGSSEQEAARSTRGYARSAVDQSGRPLSNLKERVCRMEESCLQHISEHPGKSVLIAALAGALVATFTAVCVTRHQPLDPRRWLR